MPSQPPPNTNSLEAKDRMIEIRPVTSASDISALATISDLALKSDSLFDFRIRHGAKPPYEDAFEKLTNRFHDSSGQISMFKAVSVPEDGGPDSNDEVIVGYSQWSLGYLETPKMDPFAAKRTEAGDKRDESKGAFEADALTVAVSDVDEQIAPSVDERLQASSSRKPKPFYSNPDQELSRKAGNAYITAIRGKRHLALQRLIVHPSYQRQGIGQKLIEWGVETADRENVVSWLFARPAGSRLYERNGWKVYAVLEVDVLDGDVEVAPTLAMLRLPRGGMA